jgi:hypothetical protein
MRREYRDVIEEVLGQAEPATDEGQPDAYVVDWKHQVSGARSVFPAGGLERGIEEATMTLETFQRDLKQIGEDLRRLRLNTRVLTAELKGAGPPQPAPVAQTVARSTEAPVPVLLATMPACNQTGVFCETLVEVLLSDIPDSTGIEACQQVAGGCPEVERPAPEELSAGLPAESRSTVPSDSNGFRTTGRKTPITAASREREHFASIGAFNET